MDCGCYLLWLPNMVWHKKSKCFLLKSNIPGRSVSGVPQFVDKSLWKSYGGIALFHHVPDRIHSIFSTWSSTTIPHRCILVFVAGWNHSPTRSQISRPIVPLVLRSSKTERLQRRRNSDICLWWNQQPRLCLSPWSWWSSPAAASPRGFGEGKSCVKARREGF